MSSPCWVTGKGPNVFKIAHVIHNDDSTFNYVSLHNQASIQYLIDLTNDSVIFPQCQSISSVPRLLLGLASGVGREVDKLQEPVKRNFSCRILTPPTNVSPKETDSLA